MDLANDAASPSPWQYGTGEFDPAGGRVDSFAPFAVFVSDRWQGDAILPAPHSGKAVLRAAGGEPGEQPSEAVIRRWVSPVAGTVSIGVRKEFGVAAYSNSGAAVNQIAKTVGTGNAQASAIV